MNILHLQNTLEPTTGPLKKSTLRAVLLVLHGKHFALPLCTPSTLSILALFTIINFLLNALPVGRKELNDHRKLELIQAAAVAAEQAGYNVKLITASGAE
eukprot:1149049-Pleurochrysis_carterae.AAC.1